MQQMYKLQLVSAKQAQLSLRTELSQQTTALHSEMNASFYSALMHSIELLLDEAKSVDQDKDKRIMLTQVTAA